jgi:hypothetical protein
MIKLNKNKEEIKDFIEIALNIEKNNEFFLDLKKNY